MMFALRQMMLATPMMTATPNDVCLAAHLANIASLREQRAASYLRKQMHHIAVGDASFSLHPRRFYAIMHQGGNDMKLCL